MTGVSFILLLPICQRRYADLFSRENHVTYSHFISTFRWTHENCSDLFFPCLLNCLRPITSADRGARMAGSLPFSISVYDRTRADASQWFAAPPKDATYGYVESLVRIGIAQQTSTLTGS